MPEGKFVERPLLTQLAALGWEVIDQGAGIPRDPARSLRADFREVVLPGVFRQAVRDINRTPVGQEWLTDAQIDALFEELTDHRGDDLAAINETVQGMLMRMHADVNTLTGEPDPEVRLIDFRHPERNRFHAINQFRVDTPGQVRECIIPDVVLFVNGLPLVVIEAKDASEYESNPMHAAFTQLRRYAELREETREAGLREGEPRLFHTNLLLVRTCGGEADYGTITADEEHFQPWKYIPDRYKDFTPPLGKVRAQEVLAQGLLAPATLLDILHSCSVFKDSGGRRIKVVCRYQQYRAVLGIVERLQLGATPRDRSGVVWHTQGSGKSLTMVFAIRKLRHCEELKDFKVLLVNDRRDLEEQLGEIARLTGEKPVFINSTRALKTRLKGGASNLNMVMVHKFCEREGRSAPEYLKSALALPPRFEPFGVVNASERIVLMIDEAHRSHGSDMGDNLFEAFPNAARIAFTGTPILSGKARKATVARFGEYIDKYRLRDSVADGATIGILYEGRTAETGIDDKPGFDAKFEDLFRERTEEELAAIKRKYGATGDILEAETRIGAIASDLVEHYISHILPNGFKAQVVCSSKLAAVRYQRAIDQALARFVAREEARAQPDEALLQRVRFLKTAVVLSLGDQNERADVVHAVRRSAAMRPVENFKKSFAFEGEPLTGIAFLVVCDRLLTGFDAPIEQVMYVDKRLKDHNLLQAIARVNRRASGKTRGYVVDYIGLANHLQEALAEYAGGEDEEDAQGGMLDLLSELPVLEQRYRRVIHLFESRGVGGFEDYVQQRPMTTAREFDVVEKAVELLENIKLRAEFEVDFKHFLVSLDAILPNSAADPFKIPAKRLGYVLARVRQQYKDNTLSLTGAGEKVKRLINEHLVTHGIEPKIPLIELLSDRFAEELARGGSPKAKASEMVHAIRKHCKVHFNEDPEFYKSLSEKLEALIKAHREEWDKLAAQLLLLREEVVRGRRPENGVPPDEAPFLDRIAAIAFGGGVPAGHREAARQLVQDIMQTLKEAVRLAGFWSKRHEMGRLEAALADLFLFSGIQALVDRRQNLAAEIMALAKARHDFLVNQ